MRNNGESISFKNIQRRVYDAINVLSAIGIISKLKSNLIYNGEFNIIDSQLMDNIQVNKDLILRFRKSRTKNIKKELA